MNKSKASVFFIFATITLDMIGVGLIIPTLPDIMRRFVSTEADVASYFGYFTSIYALMQFIAAPLLGVLSDQFGRKPILFVSLIMASIDYLIMAFAPNLSILFLGRILSGLSGANLTVAMAYISDVSTDQNRSSNFGLMGAAFGIGFIIGPALGGVLGHWGPQYPFVFASILNILNFLYGFFILPESLPKESRRKINFSKVNPLTGIKRIFNKQSVLPLIFIHFCFQLAGLTHPSIWSLYTKHKFSWSSAEIGFSLAAVGILSAISQGFLTRLIIPRWGELRTVITGSLGQIIVFTLFGLATEGWMLYTILIPSALMWISGPALQSLISKNTPSDEQGELQGNLVSLTSLAAILNPVITSHLFSFFSELGTNYYLPGAPYFFAAFMMILAAITVLKFKTANKLKNINN